jgi:hypothetical protein
MKVQITDFATQKIEQHEPCLRYTIMRQNFFKKSLMIPEEQSDALNRRTDNNDQI